VKVAGDAGPAARAEIADALDAEGARVLPGGWRAYTLPEPQTVAEVRADLGDAEAAVRVQLPSRVRLLASSGDPLFNNVAGGNQWGLSNTGGWPGGVPGADISALEGWSRIRSAQPVTVAVIDTGVQIDHPDLAGRIWVNPGEIPGNGLDDDGNGLVDDVNGWDFDAGDASLHDDAAGDRHGTHVAGVIAARRGNGVGIAGVADNARIMPLKFISASGTGWNVDAVSAIQYAVAKGARVINASFGGPSYDQVLCDAISWANAQGVLVVVAAGNSGANLDSAGAWPAKCPAPDLVTVTSFGHTGALSPFSNRSATHVDLAAPGEVTISTVPGGYAYMSGTSMATPHVAGVAATVLGQSPLLTPAQVRQTLLGGAVAVPDLASAVAGGRRLDLDGALAAAGVAPGPDTEAPAAFTLIGPRDGAATGLRRLAFSWSPSADTGSGLSHYRLLIDGQIAADGVGTTSATPAKPLAPGTYAWAVEAVDRAGNVTRSETRTLLVDPVAPAPFALLEPAHGAVLPAGKYVVAWTPSSDPATGLAHYEVLVDGRPHRRVAGDVTQARMGIPAGRRTLAVRAVDGAGNTTQTAARTITVLRTARGASTAALRVTPARARVGTRPVIRVRSASASRASLRIVDAHGNAVGGRVRFHLRRGQTTLVLPTGLAARLGRGAYTVRLVPDARVSASAPLRITG